MTDYTDDDTRSDDDLSNAIDAAFVRQAIDAEVRRLTGGPAKRPNEENGDGADE